MRRAWRFWGDAGARANAIEQRRCRETVSGEALITLEGPHGAARLRAEQAIGRPCVVAEAIEQRLQFERLIAVERTGVHRPRGGERTTAAIKRTRQQCDDERVAVGI